jgi:hypothetical protein
VGVRAKSQALYPWCSVRIIRTRDQHEWSNSVENQSDLVSGGNSVEDITVAGEGRRQHGGPHSREVVWRTPEAEGEDNSMEDHKGGGGGRGRTMWKTLQ